nr:MAG TPA: hypothetical protein [Ackermannviridae sp.]
MDNHQHGQGHAHFLILTRQNKMKPNITVEVELFLKFILFVN